ncbi:MAG: tryptophan synthase subunit alpha [Anaerolineae bacterium]|nr:tryptophan synthase subunit alpha [Gemmatimonadaceae bacterium]
MAARFAELSERRRRALVVYVTAGHPDPESSLHLLNSLAEHGADVIEVGVPFSDPMADGPVIQASSQKALAAGMTLGRTLDLVSRARPRVPVVLFTYLNPVLSAGREILRSAADAGVHGILITDLPVGADRDTEAWLGDSPLAFIRLVAPTTHRERMTEIARYGSGFIYLISRLGVTGKGVDISPELPRTIATLRSVTDLPICVGFGISTPEQARTVGEYADGVVVGSAVVRAADADPASALQLVSSLRAALDEVKVR